MIIYFSGNGNTKWCAEEIAKATTDTTMSICPSDPSATTSQPTVTLKEGEPLGIFFPVHGWKPPRIVLDFITNANFSTLPSYCYAVCTCGDSIGEAMTILSNALRDKGIKVSATFSIVMPETYVCLPFMYTDTLENEKRKIAEARERLVKISLTVNDRITGINELIKGPLPWFFTHIVGSFFNKYMITDSHFRVSPTLCSHCGQCAKSCPVGNITYDTAKLPQWGHNKRCTCCMACYHHCPHHAIDYGKITRKRDQYYFGIHPLGVKKQ